MAEFLGQNSIYSQFLGDKAIVRTYKGDELINEYVPQYIPPADWSDIRVDCPVNSIALYAGVKSDYSAYDNLGFTATISNSGKYKMFIDGTQYGDDYDSGATCTITWSTSGITTGDDITTPTALKAHKIWIEPATAGNNITAFKCARVAASGNENQGVLWAHFNLSNDIDIANLFYTSSTYKNTLLEACTAKNNTINFSGYLSNSFNGTKSTYIPLFVGPQSSTQLFGTFNGSKVKKVIFKNAKPSTVAQCFNNTTDLEEFKGIDFSATTFAHDFITNATNLKNTVIDMSAATGLRSLGIYGDATHFIGGLKGLIVSNQAPFNHSSLLINVSYTGLDRTAIVNLFNSLPTVSSGQIINITGCTGNQNKLTIVGSPTISNGEVSSFSDNNYITLINTPFSSSNILDIRIKFIPTEIAQGYLLWTQGVGNGIYLTVVNNQLRYGIACGGTSGIIQATAGGTYSIQTLNVPYYMHFLFNPHTLNYKLGLSSDGNNPVWGLDRTANAVPNVTGIGFGKTNSTGFYLRGSIDLNETYIKVNDELWFGREQYLLPEDKTIATSKGWSLTTT